MSRTSWHRAFTQANDFLTGGNGSGKSAVLKTIYGLLKCLAPEGRNLFEGHGITITALLERCPYDD